MKTFYVVWRMNNGAIDSDTVEIDGKVNQFTVDKAVKNKLGYYSRHDLDRIISWQEVEPFTSEEYTEFWANY